MAESIDMDKLKNFLRIGINLVNLGKKKDRFIFEV